VKITNYRKSGDLFENLLTMRPVHDSNGVYRFCIGVQLEVTEASTTVEALSQLEQLLQLLPSTIEVAGRPVGPMHLQRVQTDSEPSSASTIALKLERALASKATAAPSGVLPRLVDCFANNHRDILKELGLEAKWENTKVDVITASSVRCDSEQSPGARKSRLARRKSRTSSDRSSGESSAVHGGGVAATRSTTPPKSIHRELREMLISSAADPQLQAMASSLGLQPPTGTGWLAQLGTLADQLPHAMIVVDMSLPGAKIDLVNSAFATLTGYSKAEAKGRNCKFLQGVKTEPTAIRRICRTIQREVQETLRVINYRANGSTFRNNLTLHPVHDCAGTYRYSIGVLSDASYEAEEGASLAKLRSSLPNVIDHLQSMLADEQVMNSALPVATLQSPRDRSTKALKQRGKASTSSEGASISSRHSGSDQPRAILRNGVAQGSGSSTPVEGRRSSQGSGSSTPSGGPRRPGRRNTMPHSGLDGSRGGGSSAPPLRRHMTATTRASSSSGSSKDASTRRLHEGASLTPPERLSREGSFTKLSKSPIGSRPRSGDVRSGPGGNHGGGMREGVGGADTELPERRGLIDSDIDRGSWRSSRSSRESVDSTDSKQSMTTGTTTPTWPGTMWAATSGSTTPYSVHTPPHTPRLFDGDGMSRFDMSRPSISNEELAQMRWDLVHLRGEESVEADKGKESLNGLDAPRGSFVSTLAELPMSLSGKREHADAADGLPTIDATPMTTDIRSTRSGA